MSNGKVKFIQFNAEKYPGVVEIANKLSETEPLGNPHSVLALLIMEVGNIKLNHPAHYKNFVQRFSQTQKINQ